jgi:iron complex outermembrane receptor protein
MINNINEGKMSRDINVIKTVGLGVRTSIAAICLSTFAINNAHAQASVVIEELVVTAQKREQLVSDVPIAITAFSGDQLKALGLESSEELIAFTPGVSLAGDIGGQRAIFNIRGVVQNDYADIAEAPVAVYIDGGYLASTQAQTFGLFDVERVEVLKGPQGTLFGRNATGGLVNTITVKPTAENESYVEFTAASFEQFRVEAAISGPLSDSVRGRLSVMTNQQGEIYNNIYQDRAEPDTRAGTIGGGGDTYNDDTKAVRAQLEFDLGENGTVLLSANVADTTKSEGPYQVVNTTQVLDAEGRAIDTIFAADDPLGCDIIQGGVCIDGNGDGSVTRPFVGSDFFGNIDPDGPGRLVNKDFAFDDQNQLDSEAFSATINYDFNGIDFVSVTDYKNFSRVVGLDSDQTASPNLIFQSDGDIDQFSQEFRLTGSSDRLNWVAGLYYLKIDTDFVQGLAGAPESGILAASEANTSVVLETDSLSVFGQLDYAIHDKLTIVGGLRFIQEDKDFNGVVTISANTDDRAIEFNGVNPFVTLDSATLVNDQDLWSAKLQLEYSPNGDSLYYIGINRGVKAGSFNAPLFGGLSTYDPEELVSIEAGLKLTLLADRLQFNASVYNYDYTDYQSFTFANNTGIVTNEKANFIGMEADIVYSPASAWEMILGVSLIDAEVEDLEVATNISRDTTPAFTPDLQASGIVRYTWTLKSDSTISAQFAGSYQSETFHNAQNFTAQRIESHFKADARLSWEDVDGRWSGALFIDNLFDSDHGIIGFDVSSFYGTSQIAYAKPRTFGAVIKRSF